MGFEQLLIFFGNGAGELNGGGPAFDKVGRFRIFFGPGGVYLFGCPCLRLLVVAVAERSPHKLIDRVVGQFVVEDSPERFCGERRGRGQCHNNWRLDEVVVKTA